MGDFEAGAGELPFREKGGEPPPRRAAAGNRAGAGDSGKLMILLGCGLNGEAQCCLKFRKFLTGRELCGVLGATFGLGAGLPIPLAGILGFGASPSRLRSEVMDACGRNN